MIALALLAFAPTARVFEYVDGNASEISLQVIASIPRLTAKQADAIDALVDRIPREVEGYSRKDILDVTNGDRVRCVSGPDYVRISFSVPPENWRAGLSLMEALVRRSQLKESETPAVPRISPWMSALRSYPLAGPSRPGEVQELYRTLFRADNIALAVGGAIVPGQASEDWQKRVSAWPSVRLAPSNGFEPAPKPLTKSLSPLASIELTGTTFGANDAALSTRTLALIALGSGKGASLFRIGRQKLGYGYRQEALLYPVPEGWQPRLVQVMRPRPDLAARAETLRTALLEDVRGWTDADRQRALGMADAVFTRGVDFSPFAFGPGGAIDATLESRTFQQAYWQLKTGNAWDAQAFLQQMRSVSLEDLKEAATTILMGAKTRVLTP